MIKKKEWEGQGEGKSKERSTGVILSSSTRWTPSQGVLRKPRGRSGLSTRGKSR
jgi:hypothetical protein